MLAFLSNLLYIKWNWGLPHSIWDIPISLIQVSCVFVFFKLFINTKNSVRKWGYAATSIVFLFLLVNGWLNILTLFRMLFSYIFRLHGLYYLAPLIKGVAVVLFGYTAFIALYLIIREDGFKWAISNEQALLIVGATCLLLYIFLRLVFFFVIPQLEYIFSWETIKLTLEAFGSIAILSAGIKLQKNRS